ncbi:MAG: DNA-formamidopyrimidine glycosylase [Eubacteriales bacterium]|nr:DNA-formamidopyrimidine glycosylase [Bacillota bacterium]MBV1726941.1 DNA-formamidopyrimidine glycosylase [Desulforudis sp.]MDP3049887.1 DNA-formamidopyrimidine glycosylase [Eubacteriales bacterium]MDQ7788942.1 DNA-formamidopyrimidine glycosylase [Clostridia bacterium]MBU4533985.1 DNA-formamidopyrimidine glycosylase [Bacillota bacterium]
MPELPEVETVVRNLRTKIIGARIEEVELNMAKVVSTPDPETFARLVRSCEIRGINRRGKYILVSFSDDLVLVVHLRMTGQFVFSATAQPNPKHTHLVLHLSNGYLRFTDMRQFGRFWLVPASELNTVSGLKDLGVEPLTTAFKMNDFCDLLGRRRQKIKALLLDQRTIAGMGNIYTDEALFRSKIHPERLAVEVSVKEARALYRAVREVLNDGIAFGGTSVRDYVDAEGNEGRFQDMLRVYGKKGQSCPRCGETIRRIKAAGRGTYFCPRCQK